MSRFYDALKQASQSLPGNMDTLAPESVGDPSVAEGQTTTTDQFALPRAAQNGLMGVMTEAVLSNAARLIPNVPEPMLLEQYRQLRTKIISQQEKKPFRSLLVTSPNPKEGKTLTALNLACAFGMLPSYRVLVVDGDLRQASLSRLLQVSQRAGLANLLEGTAPLEEVVLRSNRVPFQFMAAGKSKLSAPELVHTSRWPKKIREISDHFDLVLVDTPPVNLVADAQLLAEGCDAVLLVARAFRTSRSALEQVRKDFQRFRIIGVVLNGGGRDGSYRQYKHYYEGSSVMEKP